MSTEDAKAYLAEREVPRLFESLMTGLMFNRPNDHIQFLIDSLEKVKVKGQAAVTWNMFVEAHSGKSPLPPISPENGKKRPLSRGSTTEDARPLSSASAPLPPIGSGHLINVPVIFIMGGPCSGKSSYANKLADEHPGWTNIHVGELLRSKISRKHAKDKWKAVQDLVVNGELAPQDVVFNLLSNCLKNNRQAKGFIIHGFPLNMDQVQAFETTVGHVGAVLLIDCEEDSLTRNAVSRAHTRDRLDETPSAFARRLLIFKEQTLPVLKYYDDGGKLYIIEGEQDVDTIHSELSATFDKLLQSIENGRIPTPPLRSRPSTGRWSRRSVTPSAPPLSPSEPPADSKPGFKLPNITFVPPPEIKIKDEGRRPGLPTAPIIFLAGGPGSGKGTQCAKITARYPDIVHISTGDILRRQISERGTSEEKWMMIMKLLKEGDMAPVDVTEELLMKTMQEHPDAQAYLVEGYPRDALQFEEFNRNIGGHVFTILLDCESHYLHDRLVLRGDSGNDRIDDNMHAIEKKLAFFARNTLPLLKAIEDADKLIVIDGDRDEDEIFYDIVKCLDYSLYGVKLEEGKTSEGNKGGDDEDDDDDQAQIIAEEEFVATTFTGTGGGDSFRIMRPAAPITMSGNKGSDYEDDDDEQAQIIAEEEFVATTFTGTGGGEGNTEHQYSFMIMPPADPITMSAIELSEEFETEMEEEGDKLQENHKHENVKSHEHEIKAVETEKHSELLASKQETGSPEDGGRDEESTDNTENNGRVSQASKHSGTIEHEASAVTTGHVLPRDRNNNDDEGEESAADIGEKGEEEADADEMMPDSKREEEAEIAADNNEDDENEIEDIEEAKSEMEDGENMDEE